MAFLELIKEVGPTRAGVITYVNPAVAVAAGALLLDEELTLGIGVAFTLILAGSVLATAAAGPGRRLAGYHGRHGRRAGRAAAWSPSRDFPRNVRAPQGRVMANGHPG